MSTVLSCLIQDSPCEDQGAIPDRDAEPIAVRRRPIPKLGRPVLPLHNMICSVCISDGLEMKIVLASESQFRKRALDMLSLAYEIRPSGIDEKAFETRILLI